MFVLLFITHRFCLSFSHLQQIDSRSTSTMRRTVVTSASSSLDSDCVRLSSRDHAFPVATSRDLSPFVRRDFATSPWKRFRSPGAARRRRKFHAAATNFQDVPDAANASNEEPTYSVQREVSSFGAHSTGIRARCPGFSRYSDHHHPWPPSMVLRRVPAVSASTSLRHFEQTLNVQPHITDKTDSRFHLAKSSGGCLLIYFTFSFSVLQVAVVLQVALVCGARGPGIESRCRQKVCVFRENRCDTQLCARAAHILQPSTPKDGL